MCLNCNNSLCSLNILPSLSISTSYPITSSYTFSNHPSICWSLCPHFSCDFFIYPALMCLFFLHCSHFIILLFLWIFLLSYLCTALPLSCSAACLLCVCGTPPTFASFPFPCPSFFPPSFPFFSRCLSVRRWSPSSETPSPVRRALVCAAVGPSAVQ